MIKSRGFTLLELLVVISLIGIFASIVIASVSTAKTRAVDAKIKQNIHQMDIAINAYYSQHGSYPPVANPANSPVYQGIATANVDAVFMQEVIADAYLTPNFITSLQGQTYLYVSKDSCTGSGCIQNNNKRNPCGSTPDAQAVLIFFFDGGQSSAYKAGTGTSNIICYY